MCDDYSVTAVGVDLYNQTTTGGVAKTLNSVKSDADHVPCVIVYSIDQGGGQVDVRGLEGHFADTRLHTLRRTSGCL